MEHAVLSKNIELLKQLRDLIKTSDVNGSLIEVDMPKGSGVLVGLLQSEEVSVLDGAFSRESFFAEHYHAVPEIIIVYAGECAFETKESFLGVKYWRKRTLRAGDVVTVPAGVLHRGCWKKGGKIIGILVPGSSDFPASDYNGVSIPDDV